jgi:hypothetical protein
MDDIQFSDDVPCFEIIGNRNAISLIEDESDGWETINTLATADGIRVLWAKNEYLVSFPSKLPPHHLDNGDDAVNVRDISIGKYANFHVFKNPFARLKIKPYSLSALNSASSSRMSQCLYLAYPIDDLQSDHGEI